MQLIPSFRRNSSGSFASLLFPVGRDNNNKTNMFWAIVTSQTVCKHITCVIFPLYMMFWYYFILYYTCYIRIYYYNDYYYDLLLIPFNKGLIMFMLDILKQFLFTRVSESPIILIKVMQNNKFKWWN